MRISLVLVLPCFAWLGCGLLLLPIRIANAPYVQQDNLRAAMAAEEQAILAAQTPEEVIVHKARWDLYAQKLNWSVEEEAQRRAERDAWIRDHMQPVEHGGGQQNCNGQLYRSGQFQVQCQ